MDKVNIETSVLLKVVKENRDKHVSDYKTAYAAWRDDVLSTCEANLAIAKEIASGKNVDTKFVAIPAAPFSYAGSYDAAIRKLELSNDSVIELTDRQFNELVMDQWSWKDMFASSNAKYLTK